jgi:ligand-binding sensor domain-containing protein
VLAKAQIMTVLSIPKQLVSLENANWEVFTNRSQINSILPSDNGKTLWVGTGGGLEKYDTSIRKLQRVFMNVDGLPNNEIQIIVNDNNEGLWVGTAGGLAHFYSDGKVKAFTTENSELPNNVIKSLLADGNGGVWIGARYGVDDLAHLHANGDWEIFTKEDSGLQNYAYSLLSDGNSGIWIGNGRGLIHFHANDTWTVFNTNNSELPDNSILSIQSDGSNGIWVGTDEGLAHFYADGTTWSIFNVENSELPSNRIYSIQPDKNGGIWIGTDEGLAHFHADGTTWSIFNVENFELSGNWIRSIQSDGNGGVWLVTSKGIARLKSGEDTLELFGSNNVTKKSTLPSNDIQVLFPSQDGILVGTDNGLVHLNVDGTSKSSPLDNFSTILAIESDNANGIWLGTVNGLFHLYADGTQAIFNTEGSDLKVYSLHAVGDKEVWAGTNFGLFKLFADNHDSKTLLGTPDIHVKAIEPDNKGGIWAAVGRAVHINADDTSTPFHSENSKMPNKSISSLHADGHGGVWVGLGGGAKFTPEGVVDPGNCLVHIRADETLKVIERDDSGPQLCRILSIQTDGENGIWVGFGSAGANINNIFFGGLGHLDADGDWEFFYTNGVLSEKPYLKVKYEFDTMFIFFQGKIKIPILSTVTKCAFCGTGFATPSKTFYAVF